MQTDYDVAIVGAGAAGVATAVAAADVGARVLLVERSGRLGGVVSAAMHRSICGLYSHAPQSPLDTLNDGPQRSIVKRMVQQNPASVSPRQIGRTWVLEFPGSVWENALRDACRHPRIDCRMNTGVVAVRREENHIAAIQTERQTVTISALVDCTGGGNMLTLIGNDVMLPDEPASRMLGGFSVRLSGITGDLNLLRLQIPYALAKAVAAGILPPEARFTLFHPGPGTDEGICKLAVNPDHSTGGEAEAFARRVVEHLTSQVVNLSEARVSEMSPSALAREGRRVHGKRIVTERDVLTGRQENDDAVHAWWPIEHWDVDEGPTYAYPPDGRHYDIPADALKSVKVANLFAAGTCVSATAGAAASLRASGICLATGALAGRLAAELAL